METWLEVRKQRVMINGIMEVVTAMLALLRSCPPGIVHAGKMRALPHAALAVLLAALC